MRDDFIPYQLCVLSRNSLKPYYLKIVITCDSDSRRSRQTFCQYLYEKFALRNLLLFIIVVKISSTAREEIHEQDGTSVIYLQCS